MKKSKTEKVSTAFDDAEWLAAAGLLTERQAQAYAFRVIHSINREETAEALGISKSYVDNLRTTAIEKVEVAGETIVRINNLDKGDPISPNICSECGGELDTLSIIDGEALCLDCAEIKNT